MFNQIFLCPWIYFHLCFHQFFFLDPFIYSSVSEVTIVSCLFNSVCNQAALTVSSMASFLTPPPASEHLSMQPRHLARFSFFLWALLPLLFILDVFLCCVKHTASNPSLWPSLLLDCHPHFPHILHWFFACVLYLSTIKLETSGWSKTFIYFLHTTQNCISDSVQHIMLFVRWLPVLKFLPIDCPKQILSCHNTWLILEQFFLSRLV